MLDQIDERELFIRRVCEGIEILWLDKSHMSLDELLCVITSGQPIGDDEKFAGDLTFEIEQMECA